MRKHAALSMVHGLTRISRIRLVAAALVALGLAACAPGTYPSDLSGASPTAGADDPPRRDYTRPYRIQPGF
jgi:hypothetical protein